MADTRRLVQLDHDHVWHPFTPMRQWCDGSLGETLVIERGEGEYLIDTDGNRYIDGVSSLWCNVHGHRVPEIDDAIRRQLDKISHSTLLGLASESSIELAAELVGMVRGQGAEGPRGRGAENEGAKGQMGSAESVGPSVFSTPRPLDPSAPRPLSRVFYSDSGATAVEVAFKMAVGYWYHRGKPAKSRFIGFSGAYHGDTVGAMSVGFSELFHRPFGSMVFPVRWAPTPDVLRHPAGRDSADENRGGWPGERPARAAAVRDACLAELRRLLEQHAHETAAIVLEPRMQGAAGMIAQPDGFVAGVARLARAFGVLLIADEVATGFGRTGPMFACQSETVTPDILCLAKGITGGYLPLAATMCTDDVYHAFCGELSEKRTLYHGHTYTGNALACAAALASLSLFKKNNLLEHIRRGAEIIADRLGPLRDHPHVADIRQRGVMVGVELCENRDSLRPFDFSKRTAAGLCAAMRPKGLILRPLGDVLVLMPIPAMPHDSLHRMLDIVLDTLTPFRPT